MNALRLKREYSTWRHTVVYLTAATAILILSMEGTIFQQTRRLFEPERRPLAFVAVAVLAGGLLVVVGPLKRTRVLWPGVLGFAAGVMVAMVYLVARGSVI
jgi:hypothetical protein